MSRFYSNGNHRCPENPIVRQCNRCNGSGTINLYRVQCRECRGHGVDEYFGEQCEECYGHGVRDYYGVQCPTCYGSGEVVRDGPHKNYGRYGNHMQCACGAIWFDNDY